MNNTILNISSPTLNCSDVLKYLLLCGITCNITSNKTIIKKNNKPLIENGCQIIFGDHPPNLINHTFWNNIKNKFKLDCAYIQYNDVFKGCIYDYLGPSKCPSIKN